MISEHIEDWAFRNKGLGGAFFIGGVSAATVIGVAGLAVAAGGAAVSAYGQAQAGAASAGIAGMNADIQRAQAEIDRRAARIQANDTIRSAQIDKLNAGISLRGGQIDEQNARLEKVQGDFVAATQIQNLNSDAKFSILDSQTFSQNATTLRSYARSVDAQGREQISRLREDGRRAMGVVRNKIAASGIVEEGSPLIVEGANAANIELAAQDVNYETRTQSRGAELEAVNELTKSRRAILQAKQSTRNAGRVVKGLPFAHMAADFKIAGAGLEQQAADYASQAADYKAQSGEQLLQLADDRYKVALGEADITKAGGLATQRASQMAAFGTILSGTADAASGIGKLAIA